MKLHLTKPYAYYLLPGGPVVVNLLQIAKLPARSRERADCRHSEHLRTGYPDGPLLSRRGRLSCGRLSRLSRGRGPIGE